MVALWALVLVVALVPGCRSESASSASSAASEGPSEGRKELGARPIRVAMSAAFVSDSGFYIYEQIADYLAGEIGHPVEFVTGLGYQTINDMLVDGAIDVGFVCGLPYVLLRDREQPAVSLLAAPVMRAPRYGGKPEYYSDLIVRADSDIDSFDDLAGRVFVYNEEISNSGYNMPRHRLLRAGLTEGYFGTVLRSGSHEESIRMVAEGKADASFVDSLVLEHEQSQGSPRSRQVAVIDSIGPAGIPPVVVSNHVSPALRQELARELLSMHESPSGRAILQRAAVERFVSVSDDNYDSIREMYKGAQEAGYTRIR
ncbi:MAG: phosphate/phosphite/phosphonate ABC transporter substrate-binding protein [Haliangiales bacterium]